MATIVVGDRPSMYLPGRGLWVSYAEGLRVLRLADLLQGSGGLRRRVQGVLERALSRASELGVPVQPGSVFIEDDPEVRGWRYAVVPLRVSVPEEVYPAVAGTLVKAAYRGLSTEDALRVHLEVTGV